MTENYERFMIDEQIYFDIMFDMFVGDLRLVLRKMREKG